MKFPLLRFVPFALSRSLAAEGIALWPNATEGAPEAPGLLQLSGVDAENRSEHLGNLVHAVTRGEDCNLCRGSQDWLFILGTGRSGSTTALEMVDAIPGVYLAGENQGVMNTLLDMYEASRPMMDKSAGAENRVLCSLQTFIRTLIGQFDSSNTKVIGFKEIRHLSRKQLEFFKKVFPSAKFVLNTRKNLDKQHVSQFQLDIPKYELRNWTMELELFQEAHPDDTFLLRLEDYNSDTFNKLLDFIGVRGCYFAFVAHANNGWHWNDDEDHAKRALQGHCEIENWEKERCITQVEDANLMPMNLRRKKVEDTRDLTHATNLQEVRAEEVNLMPMNLSQIGVEDSSEMPPNIRMMRGS